MAQGRFNGGRRRFLRNAGAAVATASFGPLLLSERTIAQTRTLYINSWGGSYTAAQDAAFFKPFSAATGIQIRAVTPVSYGKIKAQVQTRSYEFDMTSIISHRLTLEDAPHGYGIFNDKTDGCTKIVMRP